MSLPNDILCIIQHAVCVLDVRTYIWLTETWVGARLLAGVPGIARAASDRARLELKE